MTVVLGLPMVFLAAFLPSTLPIQRLVPTRAHIIAMTSRIDCQADEARRRFRRAAASAHPDAGGNADDFVAATQEYDAARQAAREQRNSDAAGDARVLLCATGATAWAVLATPEPHLTLLALLIAMALLDEPGKHADEGQPSISLPVAAATPTPSAAFDSMMEQAAIKMQDAVSSIAAAFR